MKWSNSLKFSTFVVKVIMNLKIIFTESADVKIYLKIPQKLLIFCCGFI